MNTALSVSCVGLLCLALVGCESADEERRVKKGARAGAVGGALMGVTLGAVSGDAGLAVAGAAAGAAIGGAGGAMYEYDQARDDRRTKMLADSIGGAGAIVVAAAR